MAQWQMKMCTPHHLLDQVTVPQPCELTTRPMAFFDRLWSGRPKTAFFPGGLGPPVWGVEPGAPHQKMFPPHSKKFLKADRLPGPPRVIFWVFLKITRRGFPKCAHSPGFCIGGEHFLVDFLVFWGSNLGFCQKWHFWWKRDFLISRHRSRANYSKLVNATLVNFCQHCARGVTTNNVENVDFPPSRKIGTGCCH